ncbi:MAG TPA: hypothetical protein PKC59_08680 [Burkholderiaceae bacterium]|nr:hypothetical protein [Burkholderiaceae bacterium]HMX09639.1 hypothetical protein [Burkholderiaceae bacterium]HMZ00723.1 hypothetical protein [Burkholderiaceae bacterium]HNB42964.1 hypothetical protein [Burkholderiaceae bacterium]HNG78615.1 hypothetical protein [Burkholderiaceae bacterium]
MSRFASIVSTASLVFSAADRPASAARWLPIALCAAFWLGPPSEAAAQAGGMNAVTKCQGGGRTSYSQDGRCPPGMEPVEMSRPALSQADALPVPPAAPATTSPVTAAPQGQSSGKATRKGPTSGSSDGYAAEVRRKRARHCESLARQLRLVDERATQPMSAAAQDHLREQRRRLQQQQAEERCP